MTDFVRALPRRLLRDWIIDSFHQLWYDSDKTWTENAFLGFGIKQLPFDLWLYQDLIYRLRPPFILQTGVSKGGSILFFAHLLDLVQAPASAVVIGVDIELTPEARRIDHPRVRLLEGSSTSADTLARVKSLLPSAQGFVSLDSDHRREHVRQEITLYAPLVGVGSYLVVEDTNINGHPTAPRWGEGPYEAVEDFLVGNQEFVRDDDVWRRNLFSFHQFGWLKRIR